MRPRLIGPIQFVIALIAAFALAACDHQMLLAPVAQAFGAPSESELVLCRQAFRSLQEKLETARVRVEPVMYAAGGDGLWQQGSRDWRSDLAESIASEARTHTRATLTLSNSSPGAAFPPRMFRSHMRYLWERAGEYSQWVKAGHQAEDFVLIVEVFSGEGKKEGAAQVYVLDGTGQIAIARWLRFPGTPSGVGELPITSIVNLLFRTLRMDADVVYPRYGVG